MKGAIVLRRLTYVMRSYARSSLVKKLFSTMFFGRVSLVLGAFGVLIIFIGRLTGVIADGDGAVCGLIVAIGTSVGIAVEGYIDDIREE